MGNSDYPAQLLCYLSEPSPAAPGSALADAEVPGLVQGRVFRVGAKPGKLINKMLNFLCLGGLSTVSLPINNAMHRRAYEL